MFLFYVLGNLKYKTRCCLKVILLNKSHSIDLCHLIYAKRFGKYRQSVLKYERSRECCFCYFTVMVITK